MLTKQKLSIDDCRLSICGLRPGGALAYAPEGIASLCLFVIKLPARNASISHDLVLPLCSCGHNEQNG